MGLWAESVYFSSFFKFGTRIGGRSIPHPGPFISKRGILYKLCWKIIGPLDQSGVTLHFFNFGARIIGCSMSYPGPFTFKKETPYLLYRTLNGPLGRSGVPLHFV